MTSPQETTSVANDDDIIVPLPTNTEAERTLLGSILLDNRLYEEVVDLLRPDRFAVEVHGRIYEAIQSEIDKGLEASPITLRERFDRDEDLDFVGKGGYLAQLTDIPVTGVDARSLAQHIRDLALKRDLYGFGRDVAAWVRSPETDADGETLIEQAEQDLSVLADEGAGTDAVSFLKAATASIANIERARKSGSSLTGVTSGLEALNEKTGGFHPGDLIIIAGSTGAGKTALAVNIAHRAATRRVIDERQGLDPSMTGSAAVGLFSLEMSSTELAQRQLGALTGIDSLALRTGRVKPHEIIKLGNAAKENANLPLYIDDTANLSITSLRSRARRLVRRRGVNLIVVDYLQLLQGMLNRRYENRTLELSQITRGLKAMAKELKVPVIALSQLSRAVEQRENKRPMLSDLRESGSIEQDSDVVLFVYREEYFKQKERPTEGTPEFFEWQNQMEDLRGKAEIIIGKQRAGPPGVVNVVWDGSTFEFKDIAASGTEELRY